MHRGVFTFPPHNDSYTRTILFRIFSFSSNSSHSLKNLMEFFYWKRYGFFSTGILQRRKLFYNLWKINHKSNIYYKFLLIPITLEDVAPQHSRTKISFFFNFTGRPTWLSYPVSLVCIPSCSNTGPIRNKPLPDLSIWNV